MGGEGGVYLCLTLSAKVLLGIRDTCYAPHPLLRGQYRLISPLLQYISLKANLTCPRNSRSVPS